MRLVWSLVTCFRRGILVGSVQNVTLVYLEPLLTFDSQYLFEPTPLSIELLTVSVWVLTLRQLHNASAKVFVIT